MINFPEMHSGLYANQIVAYEKAIKEIYKGMSIDFDKKQTRQCSRCKTWEQTAFSFLTEISWLCTACRTDDIAKRIGEVLDSLNPNASSLKEFLEKRTK